MSEFVCVALRRAESVSESVRVASLLIASGFVAGCVCAGPLRTGCHVDWVVSGLVGIGSPIHVGDTGVLASLYFPDVLVLCYLHPTLNKNNI